MVPIAKSKLSDWTKYEVLIKRNYFCKSHGGWAVRAEFEAWLNLAEVFLDEKLYWHIAPDWYGRWNAGEEMCASYPAG